VLAMRPRIPAAGAKAAIALDAAWVLGSAALLGWGLPALTAAGRSLIAITALIVGAFAGVQWIVLREGAIRGQTGDPIEVPDGAFRDIAHSWLSLKPWVKVWLSALNGLFLLAIPFYRVEPAAMWILIGYVASGPFLLAFMVPERGLSRILGLAHIVPWTPLFLYLCVRLFAGSPVGPQIVYSERPLIHAYLSVLAGAVAACLTFDYYDVVRWFRGERYLMGSHAAFERGASGLSRARHQPVATTLSSAG
jgi:hypothetical protein